MFKTLTVSLTVFLTTSLMVRLGAVTPPPPLTVSLNVKYPFLRFHVGHLVHLHVGARDTFVSQKEGNAHLNLDNYSLYKCPKLSGQAFRP